ncbi:MAG: hypothetical protein ACFHWX_02595 [Bacteroidota bacterium]
MRLSQCFCTLLILLATNLVFAQPSTSPGNVYGLTIDEIQWMREATKNQLAGCQVPGAFETKLYTPDGIGNYKALWTRDFYYMVEYAGDLLDPEEIKASINYLLSGQRKDGCIPDRVNVEGRPVYSPGPEQKPMADHALDNGPFMALLVCSYVKQYHDDILFKEVEGKLRRGLDFIHRDESGLVYNDPQNPQCPYGFTDTVKKTGHLLFSSLLYYHACREMEKLCKQYDLAVSNFYKERSTVIKKNLDRLYDKQSGMFWAADIECKQIDIWGSAYAAYLGLTNITKSKSISDYLIDNKDEIFMRGQVRHLPGSDSSWNKLFVNVKEDHYQNGAYWATPLAWVIPVIDKRDPTLARNLLQEVIKDFQENGINECINKDYLNIPNYVASATNVYALTR